VQEGGSVIESGVAREAAVPCDEQGRAGTAILFPALLALAKPRIIVAVALAGLVGMVMAGKGGAGGSSMLVGMTALAMAAAGSAMVNCVFDARMDRLMPRLRSRVEALARIGQVNLLILAAALIGGALTLAFRHLNTLAGLLMATAVLLYTLLYTLYLKRHSPFAAVVGGIPGALPVLIGYAAMAGTINRDALLLFLLLLLWQPPHFWALALQYQDDYRAAGVPVLPVAMGVHYTKLLILIYSATLLPLSLTLWLTGCCSGWYAFGATLAGIGYPAALYVFLFRQPDFKQAFRASLLYLGLVLFAILIDCWHRS